jgi:hypothetical protein
MKGLKIWVTLRGIGLHLTAATGKETALVGLDDEMTAMGFSIMRNGREGQPAVIASYR